MWALNGLSSYGAILVLWGVLFELGGFGLMYLVYRAIQREEREAPRLNERPQPPAREPSETAPTPVQPTRERELVGTRDR